jgi:RNA polymerase sigma-70 factor (ECF subfamily)
MHDTNKQVENYVASVMRVQRSLYAFILAQLPSITEAEDVLQETNLVLWSKREEFSAADNLRALIFRVARYQVLAHCKKRQRDKSGFDKALIEQLANEAEQRADALDEKRLAMVRCLQKLRPRDRQMISDRYSRNMSGKQLAEQLGRTADSVFHSLRRIRNTLMRCIQKTLAIEEQP